MKKTLYILILLFLFNSLLGGASKYFTGEVYKISKNKKQVFLRGPDLTSVKVDNILYICDKNNKLAATVKVTRYYTTVIEAKLIKGNMKSIKVKMPVYSHTSQFKRKKPIRVIRYEKDYDYYQWDVLFIYRVEEKLYQKSKILVLPKIIDVRAEGYDGVVKMDSEEISTFILENGNITGIKLKDSTAGKLEYINIALDTSRISDEEVIIEDKLGKKKIILRIDDAIGIKIVKKGKGTVLENNSSLMMKY